MTSQEAQMLQDLVRKVEGTQLTEKDPDAEALLQDGLARDPDAIYKLAQTVLIQNLALDQARAQIQQLQQQGTQVQQPARATSFLGSLLHRNPPAAAPPSGYAQTPPPYQTVPPQYQAALVYYEPAPASSGAGSFLRSAATTAAGVAAGALAFEGIESLMHGFGHGGGSFGGYGGYGSGAPAEETVINNYYDSPRGGEREASYGSNGPDEQPQGPYHQASDDIGGPDEQPQGPFDDGAQLDDASYDVSDDSSFGDDSNFA